MAACEAATTHVNLLLMSGGDARNEIAYEFPDADEQEIERVHKMRNAGKSPHSLTSPTQEAIQQCGDIAYIVGREDFKDDIGNCPKALR